MDDLDGGEVLLSFIDEDGCRVTLRLSRKVAADLCARLEHDPDRPNT